MVHETSCGVVLFRPGSEGRLYLILHYEEGHWDFPKGHVEKGENDQETIRRETFEETGIKDLEFVKGFRERIEYFYRRDGKTMHKEVFFYLASTGSAEVKLSFEHIGYEWLGYEDAVGRLTYENARQVLRKAENFLSGSNKV